MFASDPSPLKLNQPTLPAGGVWRKLACGWAGAWVCALGLLLSFDVHAADFGVAVTERNVTVKQNQLSSPLGLKVIRNDFDGPINIDVDVQGGGQDVQAYVADDPALNAGTRDTRTIDVNVDTGRHVDNGTYQVTVTARGTVNGQPRTRVATFTITVKREDTFDLKVAPNKLSVPMGSETSTKVNVTEEGHFENPVYLEIGGHSLQGFRFKFSGKQAGYLAAANPQDVMVGSQHWVTVPDAHDQSSSTLTITTFPDTPPGEYTFYVYGRRDTQVTLDRADLGTGKLIPTKMDRIYTRRVAFTVTVTPDPNFIGLVQPVEFTLTTAKDRMITPPSGYPYSNEIYVDAARSLETIKLAARLDEQAPGISVGLDRSRVRPDAGPNTLLVAVSGDAQPGIYHATITATSRGSNNKTNTMRTRVEIVVPPKAERATPRVALDDQPQPIKANCVGQGCSGPTLNAQCLGTQCPGAITVTCHDQSCTDRIALVCPGERCPASVTLDCDKNRCDAKGMTLYCGQGGCADVPGGALLSDQRDTHPAALGVNCDGQGCGGTDIIGTCFGETCPSDITLHCPGTECTDTVELNCVGNPCGGDFSYDCSGSLCAPQLQFDCDGGNCQIRESSPSGSPFLTGASPPTGALHAGAGQPSPVTPATGTGARPANTNQPAPVVTHAGSSEAIPSSNADLAAIEAAAHAIADNAGACVGAECPIVDCTTAGQLLQGLINAEANLSEMYKWLILASDDAMAHLQNLQANDILTAEQLSQAITAQGLHQALHDLGSLLLDLASLTGTIDNMATDGLDPSKVKNLDTLYGSLKTLESAVDTIADQSVKTKGTGPLNDATAGADKLLGLQHTSIGSLKSDLSDSLSAIENFKAGKPWKGARNVGQIVGRALKDISAAEIKKRQARIDAYLDSLGHSSGAIASAMAFLQQANNRRFAAEDALKAVQAAKTALMACLTKACGAVSLTRPNVPRNFNGWGAALRHFNGRMAALLSGLNGSFTVKDKCPGTDTASSLVTGEGYLGTGDNGIGVATPSAAGAQKVKAKCPRCQPIADKLTVNLTETDYWRSERKSIDEQLRQAKTLREQMRRIEQQQAANRQSIHSLNQGLAKANALGFNWGPGLAIMLRDAEARGRDLQRQKHKLEREITRLEAGKARLPAIDARLRVLRYARQRLREDLRYCEERQCRSFEQYDKHAGDSTAAGVFFGKIFGADTSVQVEQVYHITGNNPFDPHNPLATEAGQEERVTTPTPTSSPTTKRSSTSSKGTGTGTGGGTPAGSAFKPTSGSYSGNNGCGIGSTSLTVSGSTVTANPLNATNGSQTFTISGANATSNSTSLFILGAVGHTCQIQNGAANSFLLHCFRTANPSIQCDENFSK